MTEPKKMYSFYDDPAMMQRVDQVAEQEGSDRSAIIRRAIRKELIFLGLLPISGKVPTNEHTIIHAQE